MRNQNEVDIMRFEIWCEGFNSNGCYGNASFIGYSEGKNFKDACKNYAKNNKDFKKDYDGRSNTYWGCKLFDNKIEAMQNFG